MRAEPPVDTLRGDALYDAIDRARFMAYGLKGTARLSWMQRLRALRERERQIARSGVAR